MANTELKSVDLPRRSPAPLVGTKSQRQEIEKARATEHRHIEEIRQIFAGKGFTGEVLEEIVTVITADRKLWVDTMVTEGLGMDGGNRSQRSE